MASSTVLWSSAALGSSFTAVTATYLARSQPPLTSQILQALTSTSSLHDHVPWSPVSSNLPPIHLGLFTLNIKNFVTVVLNTVEEFSSWGTQFIAFLVT